MEQSISEMILKGASKRPQSFTQTLNESGSSALGALVEGVEGFSPMGTSGAESSSIFNFGETMLKMVECPDGVSRPLVEALHFLNNECRWTREWISYWIAVRGL